MRNMTRRRCLRLGGVVLSAAVLGAAIGCGGSEPATGGPDSRELEGTILADGSSTVAPITQAVAEEFQAQTRGVRVAVGISGSGGGFQKFCRGETDIADASRPIKPAEIEICAQNGVEFIELPVAFDGLAVVTNPQNSFVGCLTVSELRSIWRPEAEETVTSWSQVRDSFPDRPLVLYGPGADSGTYDYFTEAIVGESGASRGDFTPSEDDNVIVQGVAGDVDAIGFFGLAYFEANRDKLKLIGVDDGDGCVKPDAATVEDGTYKPLSRPLLMYINRDAADSRAEIDEFVGFYLASVGELARSVGYVPLGEDIYASALARYQDRVVGTMFANAALVGVSLGELLESR